MLSWESGCNFVASIESNSRWLLNRGFSGSPGAHFTNTDSQGRINFIAKKKTSESFGTVKKAADTVFSLKFVGDDSSMLACIFKISIPNLTLETFYYHEI